LKLHLSCIGKLKSGPEKSIAEDYVKRINQLGKSAGLKSLSLHESTESQKPAAPQRGSDEANFLWSTVPTAATTIVFDERGQSLSSEQFAQLIRKSADQGQSDLVFLLGGPDGHAPDTRTKANHVIALGSMTWPHRLARVMVLEQIYRAVTIMVNHPYHRP
jgi:23S rRNA (pseudouridine1915-N3)-methyltransferase